METKQAGDKLQWKTKNHMWLMEWHQHQWPWVTAKVPSAVSNLS